MVELEYQIHQLLKPFCDTALVGDASIVKNFSGYEYGIDHYLEIGEYFITIQDKWENKNPSIRDINHFIVPTTDIESRNSKKFLCGIFASRMPFTKRGVKIFDSQNKRYTNKMYFNIVCEASIEALAITTRDFVLKRLTMLGIVPIKTCDTVWSLRKHQLETVDTFNDKYLSDGVNTGIVCHPTVQEKQ